MSASWLATNIVSALLLPPLNLIIPAVAGLMLHKRWPRSGAALCAGSLIALVVLSTDAGARLFTAPLEKLAVPLASARGTGAQAIVVLGGGRLKNAPEYDGRDIPSPVTLVRLRYGARLHRETGLPLLVTGGAPDGSAESEAAAMARVLRDDFATPVKWLEQESDNTAQNAEFSARLLKQARVQRILLVTDAMHMPRSQAIFMQSGLQVVPAPTYFSSRAPLEASDFVPNGGALKQTHYAMHEWIGLCWYWLRHGSAMPQSIQP
ncbi:MAG: hypothetical protein JWQ21_76 [Herminiimonas sp.]|nr:hypothetical protein [Herminiimonas sp.]